MILRKVGNVPTRTAMYAGKDWASSWLGSFQMLGIGM